MTTQEAYPQNRQKCEIKTPQNALTITEMVQEAKRVLVNAGIVSALQDAHYIIAECEGLSRLDFINNPERIIQHKTLIWTYITRRARHEPVARILARRGFWKHDFIVTPAVLDPRPESETLIESSLEFFKNQTVPLSILDLGTGSGCLLLSLLAEYPHATGLGIDLSADALAVASQNAHNTGVADRVTWRQGNWFDPVEKGEVFDLVISNPPYIETKIIPTLEADVRDYDPILALDGGGDGLSAYRSILTALKLHLKPSGKCILEFGINQTSAICHLAQQENLHCLKIHTDLGGIERCITLAS